MEIGAQARGIVKQYTYLHRLTQFQIKCHDANAMNPFR